MSAKTEFIHNRIMMIRQQYVTSAGLSYEAIAMLNEYGKQLVFAELEEAEAHLAAVRLKKFGPQY